MRLNLTIGPGTMEIRQKLYEMAEKNPPFKPAWKKLFPKWTNIYSKTVLSKKELESLELESEKLIEKNDELWENILQHDLQAMIKVVNAQTWLFEPVK